MKSLYRHHSLELEKHQIDAVESIDDGIYTWIIRLTLPDDRKILRCNDGTITYADKFSWCPFQYNIFCSFLTKVFE